MDRRSFLAAGTATVVTSLAAPALAQRRVWTMPEEFKPRVINLQGELPPNEIHVDPKTFALYWTMPEGKAIKYTCGVGRGDLYESGTFVMGAKKEWPSWTPTPDMIEREPEKYERWKDGRPGGPGNPLGARALYLFTRGGRDTFLRIHGTTAPWTINSAVSNGCVRLTNAHIAHLYQQVPLGVKVVLHPKR